MFRCYVGKEVVGPRKAARKIILKSRKVTYHNSVPSKTEVGYDGDPKSEEKTTFGSEIVKEALACEEHARLYKQT